MFEKIVKGVQDAVTDITTAAKRYVGAHEMGRVAAVAAMMAYLPDGDADDDEIMQGVIAIQSRMGDAYKIDELVTAIQARVKKLQASKRFGKAALLEEIAPAKDTPEAFFLVQVAAAVGEAVDPAAPKGGADPFTPAEWALAKEIAVALGVDPKTAGI